MKYRIWLVALSISVALTACGSLDTEAPVVVGTDPPNGSRDIDPGLTSISVTFSKAMLDQSWSWADGGEDRFPRITGNPSYDSKFETNTIPVILEPDKTYVIWINRGRLLNFKDEAGNPAAPYRLTFKTR
ncbi:MAG: Ig-like domain-containing protein [Ectothiorhodospiraceae bacterium AqS1]|nr:Ig-like domain-containing protein [Ectothiorhodospiraceae bacterium AqS1]